MDFENYEMILRVEDNQRSFTINTPLKTMKKMMIMEVINEKMS